MDDAFYIDDLLGFDERSGSILKAVLAEMSNPYIQEADLFTLMKGKVKKGTLEKYLEKLVSDGVLTRFQSQRDGRTFFYFDDKIARRETGDEKEICEELLSIFKAKREVGQMPLAEVDFDWADVHINSTSIGNILGFGKTHSKKDKAILTLLEMGVFTRGSSIEKKTFYHFDLARLCGVMDETIISLLRDGRRQLWPIIRDDPFILWPLASETVSENSELMLNCPECGFDFVLPYYDTKRNLKPEVYARLFSTSNITIISGSEEMRKQVGNLINFDSDNSLKDGERLLWECRACGGFEYESLRGWRGDKAFLRSHLKIPRKGIDLWLDFGEQRRRKFPGYMGKFLEKIGNPSLV